MSKLFKISAIHLLGFLLIKNSVCTLLLNYQNSQFNGNQFNQCNQNRLQRCQQSVMSMVSQNVGGVANNNGLQSNQFLQCSSLRRSLDCILIYTPLCQSNAFPGTGVNGANELIPRAKDYLDRVCDQSGGWRASQCYQRPAVQQCEIQYKNQQQLSSNSKCAAFQMFRNCVANAIRVSCGIQDIQLLSSYLIDKAHDLVWTCPSSQDNFRNNPFDNQYGIANQNIPFNLLQPFSPNNQNRFNGQFNPRNPNNLNNQYVPSAGNGFNGANGPFGFSNPSNAQFGPSNANGLTGEFGANNSNGPFSQLGLANLNNPPNNQLSTSNQSGPFSQFGI